MNTCCYELSQTNLFAQLHLLLETAEPSGSDKIISNHVDDNGEAPIHVAARTNNVQIMKILLQYGADVGLVDGRGRTCLHCAAQAGHTSCLAYAIDSGADEWIDVRQDDGYTCLHLAVRSNKMECAEILLQAGADVAAEAADGSNAHDLARLGNKKIAKLLLEYDTPDLGQDSEVNLDFDDDCDSLSLSGSDMFNGLNTYILSPPPKHAASHHWVDADDYYDNDDDATEIRFIQQSQYYDRARSSTRLEHCSPPPGHLLHSQQSHHVDGGIRWSVPNNQIGHQFLQQSYPSSMGFSSSYHYGPQIPGNNFHQHTSYDEGEFTYCNEQWMIGFAEDGHQYFYNINKDVSTWEDPRENVMSPVNASLSLYCAPQVSTSNHHTEPETNRKTNETMHVCGQSNHERIAPHQVPSSALGSSNINTEVNREQDEKRSTINQHPTDSDISSTIQHTAAEVACNSFEIETATKCSIHLPESKMTPPPPNHDCSTSGLNANIMTETTKKLKESISKIENTPLAASLANNRNNNTTPLSQQYITEQEQESHTSDKSPQKPSRDQNFAKYRKMLAVGVPLSSVCHAMKQEGISDKEMKHFEELSNRKQGEDTISNEEAPKTGTPEPPTNAKKDPLAKYLKMKAVGIPFSAILHKMAQEGVDESKVHLFKIANGLKIPNNSLPLPPSKTAEQQIAPSKEDLKKEMQLDQSIAKYMKMKAVGIPLSAVKMKMSTDGVDKNKIEMFNEVFGTSASDSAPKSFPMPPVPRERRRASKAMQKIHWNTVPEQRIHNSLWAKTPDEDLLQSEIESLESLFSASPINKVPAAGHKKTLIKSASNKKKTSLIDPKRANNIAISLAQFRKFDSYDSLCFAVASLDRENLNAEQLSNMQLLLPTPDELKR